MSSKQKTGEDAPSARKTKAKTDEQLDRALEDSFPASDPTVQQQPLTTAPPAPPKVQEGNPPAARPERKPEGPHGKEKRRRPG